LSQESWTNGERSPERPTAGRWGGGAVLGLYFAGPGATFSFGPLFRFVAGAAHAAPVVARHLSRRL
jgi:hypothetical protein